MIPANFEAICFFFSTGKDGVLQVNFSLWSKKYFLITWAKSAHEGKDKKWIKGTKLHCALSISNLQYDKIINIGSVIAVSKQRG